LTDPALQKGGTWRALDPIMGAWGLFPQWGPEAEPLVRESGSEDGSEDPLSRDSGSGDWNTLAM